MNEPEPTLDGRTVAEVTDMVVELRAMRSTDPAAAAALRAARLTAITLERWWLDASTPQDQTPLDQTPQDQTRPDQ